MQKSDIWSLGMLVYFLFFGKEKKFSWNAEKLSIKEIL